MGPKEGERKQRMESKSVLEGCVGTVVWEAGIDVKALKAIKLILAM